LALIQYHRFGARNIFMMPVSTAHFINICCVAPLQRCELCEWFLDCDRVLWLTVGSPSASEWNSAASESSASAHCSVLRQWRRCQRLVHFHGIHSWGQSPSTSLILITAVSQHFDWVTEETSSLWNLLQSSSKILLVNWLKLEYPGKECQSNKKTDKSSSSSNRTLICKPFLYEWSNCCMLVCHIWVVCNGVSSVCCS